MKDALNPAVADRLLVWLHRRLTKWLQRRGTLTSTRMQWKPSPGAYPEIDARDLAGMIPLDIEEPIDPRLLELLKRTPAQQALARGDRRRR